jgi:hypothetical protein
LAVSWLVCLPLDAKIAGSNPDKAMDFKGRYKSATQLPLGWEVKPEVPRRKILRHEKNSESPTGTNRLNSHFLRPSPTVPEALW